MARLREERVPERRADERGAQRIVLGYVLEDHSEGTPFVEDAEGGGAQWVHRCRHERARSAACFYKSQRAELIHPRAAAARARVRS